MNNTRIQNKVHLFKCRKWRDLPCVGSIAVGRQREALGGNERSQFLSGHEPDGASGCIHAGLAGWHVLPGEATGEISGGLCVGPEGGEGRVPHSHAALRFSFCPWLWSSPGGVRAGRSITTQQHSAAFATLGGIKKKKPKQQATPICSKKS